MLLSHRLIEEIYSIHLLFFEYDVTL